MRAALAAEIAAILTPVAKPLDPDPAHKPHVVLVIGRQRHRQDHDHRQARALLAAATASASCSRPATRSAPPRSSSSQVWGERAGATVVVAARPGADAAGLAFEALERAKAAGADLLLVDTAGRLHNKANLMAELGKITRVLKKLDPTAPHDVLLVLDATTGQNALRQVETFREIVRLTGLVVTKLDGTAKGGVLVALAETVRAAGGCDRRRRGRRGSASLRGRKLRRLAARTGRFGSLTDGDPRDARVTNQLLREVSTLSACFWPQFISVMLRFRIDPPAYPNVS